MNQNIPKVLSSTKNPIGLIVLFIWLIYAMTCTIFGFTIEKLSSVERLILIIFIVLYPLVLLTLFFILVTKHNMKLFAPQDFKDESNFLRTINRQLEDIKFQNAVSDKLSDLPASVDQLEDLINKLLNSNQTGTLIRLGRGYLKANKFENALKYFQSLIHKVPKHDLYYYKIYTNIGYSYIGVNNFHDAAYNLELAKDILRHEVEIWQLVPLAYCYYRIGETEKMNDLLSVAKAHKDFGSHLREYVTRYPDFEKQLVK